jgi:hypothetical protein
MQNETPFHPTNLLARNCRCVSCHDEVPTAKLVIDRTHQGDEVFLLIGSDPPVAVRAAAIAAVDQEHPRATWTVTNDRKMVIAREGECVVQLRTREALREDAAKLVATATVGNVYTSIDGLATLRLVSYDAASMQWCTEERSGAESHYRFVTQRGLIEQLASRDWVQR